jgi:hypothetical protein
VRTVRATLVSCGYGAAEAAGGPAGPGLASLHGVTWFQFFQPDIEPGTERAFWAMVSGPVAGTEAGGHGWRVYPRGCRSASISGPVAGGNLWSCYPLVG